MRGSRLGVPSGEKRVFVTLSLDAQTPARRSGGESTGSRRKLQFSSEFFSSLARFESWSMPSRLRPEPAFRREDLLRPRLGHNRDFPFFFQTTVARPLLTLLKQSMLAMADTFLSTSGFFAVPRHAENSTKKKRGAVFVYVQRAWLIW